MVSALTVGFSKKFALVVLNDPGFTNLHKYQFSIIQLLFAVKPVGD